MLTLFEQYKSAGKITDAILIGRNMLNKHAGDSEIFSSYFELLCSLAESLPALSDRESFAEQANVALAFYSESAELDDNTVISINTAKQKLNSIFSDIMQAENELAEATYSNAVRQNDSILVELVELKDKMRTMDTQEKFDILLKSISAVDMKLNKETFTNEQSILYDSLTKDYTDTISAKMREFERRENVNYNKKAVMAFATAFSKFRGNENLYANQTKLFSLASESLFAYDSSRLFNETLIYYNHVYSYIFSKLDDDGKLALTRFSIECEKNRR